MLNLLCSTGPLSCALNGSQSTKIPYRWFKSAWFVHPGIIKNAVVFHNNKNSCMCVSVQCYLTAHPVNVLVFLLLLLPFSPVPVDI